MYIVKAMPYNLKIVKLILLLGTWKVWITSIFCISLIVLIYFYSFYINKQVLCYKTRIKILNILKRFKGTPK